MIKTKHIDILMIDNYDSFTFNLVQFLGILGENIKVRRNDRITLDPSYKIGDNWTVSGTGNFITDKRLEWNYELIIAGSQQSCTAVYTK